MEWPMEPWEGDLAVAMVQAMADMISWVLIAQLALLLGVAVLARHPVVVRRFWCAVASRDVEVVFARKLLPLLRPALTVQCCSAFDPPAAVACDRGCVNADRRQPAPPPALVVMRS
jgi:hypothetical protein